MGRGREKGLDPHVGATVKLELSRENGPIT